MYADRIPQYFGQAVVSTTCSAGNIGALGLDFGIRASSILIENAKASIVYLSFDTTTGSTGGYPLAAGKRMDLTGAPIGGMALASTATSTGDFVNIFAVQCSGIDLSS